MIMMENLLNNLQIDERIVDALNEIPCQSFIIIRPLCNEKCHYYKDGRCDFRYSHPKCDIKQYNQECDLIYYLWNNDFQEGGWE